MRTTMRERHAGSGRRVKGVGMAAAVGLALLAAPSGSAAPVAHDAHLALLGQRLFPTLSSDGHAVLVHPRERAVANMLAARRGRIERCAQAPSCVVAASIWQDGERDLLVQSANDDSRDQLRREIDGLNGIVQVYGVSRLPSYPLIDGPDVPFGSPAFTTRVADAVALGTAQRDDPAVAGDPSLSLALALLDVNGRDDAVAFEPLDRTYNGPALARARTLDWSHYRYSAIIALGIGPDDLVTPLSPRGKFSVRTAADRFAQGDAAFIIVSGSRVHPRGTTFAEAIEMRRALTERFGIPADAIVVEPYARHTTTNLRNATRRLAALGAPLDRDTLVVSNPTQIDTVASAEFAARNGRELGYQPGTVGARVSPTAVTFRPSAASLRIDPADPLDP